jgi:hypothetical protein
MGDDIVDRYFERLNRELVASIPASAKLKVERAKGGKPRRGPVLRIADELKLFDHIEAPAVRVQLYPTLPGGFQVMRPTDMRRERGEVLGYSLEPQGNCRFTYRHTNRDASAKGGGAGRAKGKKDLEPHLEPTIYVEKVDALGNAIPDSDDKTVGSWRAFMVTFPLKEGVREVKAAEIALPVQHSVYDHYLNDEERGLRDSSP